MNRKVILMILSILICISFTGATAFARVFEENPAEAGSTVDQPVPVKTKDKVSILSDSKMEIPAPIVYEVNRGDTLSKISRAFGVPVGDIMAFNGIDNPNVLQVGQKLEIPAVNASLPGMSGKRPVIQKVLTSTLTAYTSGAESTGKTPSHPAYGITKSGVKASEGRTIAVDPKVIPLGTTVFIEGVGIRKAEDIGSAIKGSKIDVYMEDVDEAIDFGVKKNVKVYVLGSA